eukprot:IDg14192t1
MMLDITAAHEGFRDKIISDIGFYAVLRLMQIEDETYVTSRTEFRSIINVPLCLSEQSIIRN